MKTIVISDKTYTSESIIDLDSDVQDVCGNALYHGAEKDENGFIKGVFRVIIEWTNEE